MKRVILVTGSEGLIGTALCRALRASTYDVRCLDIALPHGNPAHGDVSDRSSVQRMMQGCVGVVHLAAVSRVVWGERDPGLCWQTNAIGSKNVVDVAQATSERPWVLFASSREVYGQPDKMPVVEQCPLAPINVYGRAKAYAEGLVQAAQQDGLCSSIVRLSNVYGSVEDHPDRVIPAFTRAAASGQTLRVEGSDRTFDFTHLDDVIVGLCSIIQHLEQARSSLPPIQLVTGVPTRLGQLARLACEAAGKGAIIVETTGRDYDVRCFVGEPSRARELLGWSANVTLEQGVARMIAQLSVHR